MKRSTVKNLMIGSIALLGISYVVESYIRTKKREREIENSKLDDEIEMSTERVYHTIGNAVINEDGKITTEPVKEIKRVI